jgi:hypothetical protein
MVPPRTSTEDIGGSYARSRIGGGDVPAPILAPRRTAMSSATMLIAISSGVIAPMRKPMGA